MATHEFIERWKAYTAAAFALSQVWDGQEPIEDALLALPADEDGKNFHELFQGTITESFDEHCFSLWAMQDLLVENSELFVAFLNGAKGDEALSEPVEAIQLWTEED